MFGQAMSSHVQYTNCAKFHNVGLGEHMLWALGKSFTVPLNLSLQVG